MPLHTKPAKDMPLIGACGVSVVEHGLRYLPEIEDWPGPEAVLAAAVKIQLGVSRSPAWRDVRDLARNPFPEQPQVKQLLHQLNKKHLPEEEISLMAAAIHLKCEWALHFRQTLKPRVSRGNRRVTEQRWKTAQPPKQELARLYEESKSGTFASFVNAVVGISPYARTFLYRSARSVGISFNEPWYLLCRECMARAADLARADPALSGRPAMLAHDAVVQLIRRIYHELTGRTGSGRAFVSEAYPDSGKPTGRLHSLLVQIGEIYCLALPDDRLRPKRQRKRRKSQKPGLSPTFSRSR